MVIIMIVFQLQTSCLYTNVLLESLAIKKVLLSNKFNYIKLNVKFSLTESDF